MTPLRFCFAIHLHQPVGNFRSVFEDHLRDVYHPLVSALMQGEAAPVALHLSGPLLEWLEEHAPAFVDLVGTHVDAGQIELLTSGHDEPILAALSRDDRREQVQRHREHLRRRFGVDAGGLWLTERVWEPGLPEDLVPAGVRFALVDDRHFIVAGFHPEALHGHYRTESGGAAMTLFPIAEHLRYLIPFRPPAEIAAHLRGLRDAGHRLAILGDDGEKFGGWPGTLEWVYRSGWLDEFLATMRALRDEGVVAFSRFDDAMTAVPSAGLAYLPSASYREMEGWSLPPVPARALLVAERGWAGDADISRRALLRGSHWRNFLVRYPESNRLHKMVAAVSRLARERGDPAHARRAIGQAQCNDAYWHGVFGGLYLPFLRAPLWAALARGEGHLRAGEAIAADVLDIDADGHDEVWVHSAGVSAVVAPSRGGAIEVLLDLGDGVNVADVLTRYREAYHEPLPAPDDGHHVEGGAPSIHDLEGQLDEAPPVDDAVRALFVDRVVEAGTTLDDFVAGGPPTVRRLWAERLQAEVHAGDDAVTVAMTGERWSKVLTIAADGAVACEWAWEPGETGWFVTELSVACDVTVDAPGADAWRYPIETVAKSEKGFDRMRQGEALVFRWPMVAGRARVTFRRASR